ncbi:serine hydrolase [Nocardia sp. NPDC050717]|uniref:serine hydrolase domain-containing protein n=1 Tax=Nocardia sp. NPDC050717 TaxID=3157221 RepID=UPI00340037AE
MIQPLALPEPVSLGVWQQGPHNRRTLGRIREMVPTARVAASKRPLSLPRGEPLNLDLPLSSASAGETTVQATLARTFADGLIVLHHGKVRHESYPGDLSTDRTHALYSISKSIIGVVAAQLAVAGLLDVDALVTHYVPELAESGYAGATVCDVLDMRTGIQFSEEYLTPGSGSHLVDQAVGWAPATDGSPESLYEYLTTLRADRPHGGVFEYRSCETDVLGWICERAGRERMPEMLSRNVWSRVAENDMDAGVDRAGSVFHDGGLAATLRDLARFGEALRRDAGVENRVGLVAGEWLGDCLTDGPEYRQAFAASPSHTAELFPGGMYRNQFWVPYADRRVLLCIGIHGQVLYIDIDNAAVIAQVSSWPEPVVDELAYDVLAGIETIVAAL